jgi:hypothetical protein
LQCDSLCKYFLRRSTALNECNLARSYTIRLSQLIYASLLERRAKLPLKYYVIIEWILRGIRFEILLISTRKGESWRTVVTTALRDASVMRIESKTANPRPKSTKSKNRFPSTWKKALRFDSTPYDFRVACVECTMKQRKYTEKKNKYMQK